MKTKILFCSLTLVFNLIGASLLKPALAATMPVTEIPRITLQNAITIAEGALSKENIDKTKYFIYAVDYTRAGEGWYYDFTFKPVDPTDRDQIHVRVYMNSQTEVRTSGSRRR